MQMFGAMFTSASGLTAERLRMEVISANLANAGATRTVDGGPYRRQLTVVAPRDQSSFQAMLQQFRGSGGVEPATTGVRVLGIVGDESPFDVRYEPGHPDADEDGFVLFPNVDVVMEMVDLISASRAYEANVTAIEAARHMAMRALEIGRG